MIRTILDSPRWQTFLKTLKSREVITPLAAAVRGTPHRIEVLEARIAPAAVLDLMPGENVDVSGDLLGDLLTVFSVGGGTHVGFYNSGGLVSLDVDGVNVIQINATEIHVLHTAMDAGTLTMSGGGGTDQLILNAGLPVFNGLTADFENIDPVLGLTIGGGGLLLSATASDITITGNISKISGGDATADIRSVGSIIINSGADITSSTNKLHVILNADRDASGSGGVYLLSGGTTIATLGGDFTIGGGATPAATPVFGPTDKAIFIDGATISTGAGNISIRGQGDAVSGGGASIGIDLTNGTSITTTSGNITIVGTGGAVSDSFTMGVSVFNGSSVVTATGAISITGTTSATGSNAYGVKIQSNSKVEATGNGSIVITGSGAAGGSGSANDGIALFDNADVISQGSGAINLSGTPGAGSLGINTGSGANDIQVGKGPVGTYSGALSLTADSINLQTTGVTLETTGTATFTGLTVGRTIDVGGADGASLGLTDGELNRVTASTLQIGDSSSGAITVSAAIAHATSSNFALTGGGNIVFSSGSLSTGGGSLTLTPGAAGSVQPTTSGVDVTTSAATALAFGAGADLAISITGATVDTQYSQLNVAGLVNLSGVDLVLSGAYVPAFGDSFILVKNDAADAVTGTFNGLPEASIVTINGVQKRLTYIGGDGNDVALVPPATTDVGLSGGNLVITDGNGGTTNDSLTITLNGANVRISDPANVLLAGSGATQIDANTIEVPLASVTGSIQVNTLGGNDTLTLALAGGDFIVASGLTYAGGAAGNDSLFITGGAQGTVTYTYINANDGNIVSSTFGTIAYTGLEPIVNTGTATDIIFNLPGTADLATLEDDGTAGNNITRLRSTAGAPTFELTDFATPTGSVTINLGGDNATFSIAAVDSLFGATLTLDGQGGTDTVNFTGALTIAGAGNVSVTSETIGLGANISTDGGSITLTGDTQLTASSTLDTEAGDNSAAGSLVIVGAISGTAIGRDLTINTAVVGFTGGNVTLGVFGSAGSQFINDLAITTNSDRTTTFNDTVQLDENTNTDGATLTVSGGGKIALGALANATVNFDTDNGNNAVLTAGISAIDLGSSPIYAINTGVTLNLSTADSTTADANKGTVIVGAIGNNSGANQFLRSVTFTESHPAGATASPAVLNGDIFVDGGNITFTSASPQLQTNLTFDTAQGATAVAGSFSASNSFGSLTGAKDLTINTSAATTAGSISILGPNNAGINDLQLTATGATPGNVQINGNLFLDNVGADLPSFAYTGGGRLILGGAGVIDTEQGNDSSGGSVDLTGFASISGNAAGRDFTVNTATTFAGGNAGNVTLTVYDSVGGGQFINDTTITATPGAGGTGGIVTLTGNISLNNNAADDGTLAIATGNQIVLTTSITVDTEQGNDGIGGLANFTGGTNSTTISASAAGIDLTINTGTTLAATNSGNVALPQFGNTAGFYINDISIDQTKGAAANGPPTLFFDTASTQAAVGTGSILLDNNGADLASFILVGAERVQLSAPGAGSTNLTITLDTEQGNDAAGGAVSFGSGSTLGGVLNRRDFVIDTSSTAGAGGDITFGAINTFTGATALNDLTINAAGNTIATAGNIIFTNGTVALDDPGPTDPGSLTVTGGNIRLALAAAGTITMNTGIANSGAVGDVNLAGATGISATIAGIDLSINNGVSTTVGQAGANVTLPAFTNAGGAYVNDLTVAVSANGAGLNGTLTLTGDIQLNENTTDGAAFTVGAAGTGNIGLIFANPTAATLTIDTDLGDDGTALASRNEFLGNNSVQFVPGAAGKALVIDTRSNTNATNQGNVQFGGTGVNAGNYFTALTVNMSTNGSFGTFTLSGDALVEGNIAVTGPITLGGTAGATRVVNTNPDGAGAGGSFTVQGLAGAFQSINSNSDRDFTITTFGVGGAGGAVSIGAVNINTTNAVNDLIVATGGTTAGSITLGGNLSVDNNVADLGSISFTGGGSIVLGASFTIDTEDANDASGGDVNFGTSAVSGNALGRDLTLNTLTTFATGAGGSVVLAGFGSGGGFFVNDLTINATPGAGGVAGQTTLTADIALDENAVADPSSFNINGNGRVLIDPTTGTTLTIDLDDADNLLAGAAWSANWNTSAVTADTAGIDLVINAKSASTANFPTAQFGAMDNSGGAFLRSFLTDLRGNVSAFAGDQNFAVANVGTATFNGDIALDGGAFTVRGAATMNATAGTTRTIDTAQTATTGGAISIGGTVGRNNANIDLVLNTSGATAGGAIRLGNGSAVFHSITFNPQGASAATTGDVTLADNFQVDDNTVTVGSVSVLGSGRMVLAATVEGTPDTQVRFDMDAAGGIASGTLNLGNLSSISALAAGLDFAINAHSDTVGQVGGTAVLPRFDNVAGFYVNDLTATLQGNTSAAGPLTLTGDILLDNNAADDGSFTYGNAGTAGTGRIIIAPAAGTTLTLDTEQGNDGIGGAVNLASGGTGIVSAGAAGRTFSINTGTTAAASAAGNVTLANFGDTGGGFFLRNLAISTVGTTGAPTVTANGGTISLDDDGAGGAGSFAVVGGNFRITTSTTIDTEQGDSANGGTVNLGTVSSSSNANDLAIGTGTAFAGGTGGAISIATIAANGTNFLNDVAISTAAATPGSLFLGGNVSLNDNAVADTGSFTLTGGGNLVLTASATIDTEAGDNADGGLVDLGGSPVSASAAGTDLTIVTATAFAGGTGGAVTLGAFGNAGGSYINDLGVNRTAATAGIISLSAAIVTNANAADTGDITFTGNGNIVVSAAAGIATDAAGGTTNAGTLAFTGMTTGQLTGDLAAGLAINTTADGGGTASALSLPVVNITGAGDTFTVTSGALTFGAITTADGGIALTGIGLTQTAATTAASGTATIALDANGGAVNLPGTLTSTNTTAGAITLQDATTVALGHVNAVGGALSAFVLGVGQNITGAVSQNAGTVLNLSNLTASLASSASLGGANTIGTLGSVTRGGAFTLNDTTGGLIVAGPLTGGTTANNVSLTTAGGSLAVNGALTGAAVTLTASGAGSAVTNSAAITASGLLTATANAGVALSSVAAAQFTATTATGGVTLSNTGVLAITGIAVTTSGDILVTNTGALSTSGAVSTASGTITMSAASPITVGANVTAPGDIVFTAGEISDAPVWADDFTLSGGATIQSTAGNITLRAGDDIHLNAGTTVNASGTVTLTAGFGDLDGAGSLDLQGTIISGTGLSLTAPDDITVGLINAPGQTVTLTADSDNNGIGGIFDTNDVGIDVIADVLILSGSLQLNAAGQGLPATTGIKLETQVGTLTATVGTAPGASTGGIAIANTGALNITGLTTNAGDILVSNVGAVTVSSDITAGAGGLTLTAASPVTIAANLTAAGAILVTAGEISDSPGFADDLTVNSGISVTSTGSSVTLEAGDDILISGGVASQIEGATTVTLTAANGDLDNHGGVTLDGSLVGPTGVTVTARDNIALGAGATSSAGSIIVSTTQGSITRTAGTLSAASGSVTLTATNGGVGTVGAKVQTATDSITATAGGAGGVFINESNAAALSSIITAGGNVDISATLGALTIGTISAGAGDVTLTATGAGGGILDDGANGNTTIDITANDLSIASGTAGIGDNAVGAIDVDVDTIAVATTIGANAGVLINTLDSNNSGVLVTLVDIGGNGDITLTATSGSGTKTYTTVDNNNGNISIDATLGNIVLGNITSDSGVVGTSDITVTAQAGSITVNGVITSDDNVTLTAATTINDNAADNVADIVANTVTLSAQTGIGTTSSLDLDVNTLTAASSVTGGIAIDLLDANNSGVAVTTATASTSGNVTFTGTTGTGTRSFGTINATSGSIAISANGGNIDIAGNQTASGAIAITSNATGDITRSGAGATLTAPAVTLTANGADGDIGTGANPILTTTATLSFAGGGTGDVFITESNGASVSGTTGSGSVTLVTTTGDWTVIGTGISTTGNVNLTASAGDLIRSGAGAIVSGNTVTLTAGGADGDIGSIGTRFLTTATSVVFAGAGTGDVFVTESNGANVQGTTGSGLIDLLTTSGDWTINGNVATTGNVNVTASAGDILRTGATSSVNGNVVTLTAGGANGDIGSSVSPVLTAATTIAFTGTGTGDVFIAESDNAAISGSTGTGDITLVTTGGSFTLGLVSTSAAVGTVSIDASDAILDGNLGANNIVALGALLISGTGVGTVGDKLDTTIVNLEADGGLGGVFISDAGTLNIGGVSGFNGVASTTDDIMITSGGALTIGEDIVASSGDVMLTATAGSITETGGSITGSLLTTVSVGGTLLNDAANQVEAFNATNTGSGNVQLINTAAPLDIQLISNATGGNVFVSNTGDAGVSGAVTSGNPANGGDITIISDGLLTVDANVNSSAGTGGTLTLSNSVIVNASPTVGFGDIILQGGAGSLLINAPITVAVPLTLTATDNVVINAAVTVTGLGNDLTVIADTDLDTEGGVLVTTPGRLNAGRDLSVRGSDFVNASYGFGPFPGSSIMIESDGLNAQLLATRSVLVQNSTAAGLAAINLGGRVESTNSNLTIGNMLFDGPVELIDDDAAAIIAGVGSVTFASTIDSAGGNDLTVRTDLGNVNFIGVVGGVNAPGDILIPQAGNVHAFNALTADTFTVTNAALTVTYDGAVTIDGTGDAHSVHAQSLVTNAAVTSTAGNILWEVDNIEINDTVAGSETLTIRPIDATRSIGLNGAGLLNLDTAEIGQLQDGFTQITIGRTNGSGTVSTDGATFLDPTTILAPSTGGIINVDGTLDGQDDASFTLRAPTINLSVATPDAALQTEARLVHLIGNVKLLADTLIDTNFAAAGGEVTVDGTINGAFGLMIDAGLFAAGGAVNLNGGVASPGGASVGGGTALTSIDISGGTITLHPQIITTGAQSYHAIAEIVTFGGALRSRTSGAITIDGPLTLNARLPIITSGIAGADVIFTGTVNSEAGEDGALAINAGVNGNVSFAGDVGTGVPLANLEITKSANVTFDDGLAVLEFIKIDATEIDFDGGANSVSGATLTLQTAVTTQAVHVGGAADSGAGVLDITVADLDALVDGFTSVTIARAAGTAGITIDAAGIDITDPFIFRQSTRTGTIDVNGPIDATDNGSVTMVSSTTTFHAGADITTDGGKIDIDYAYLDADIDFTTAGGDIIFRSSLLDTGAGGHELTLNAGAGNITFTQSVGTVGPILGLITANSTGTTKILSSLKAEGLVTDAGGVTQLKGNEIRTTTDAGQIYGDDIVLLSSIRLRADLDGPISIAGTVNALLAKTFSFSAQTETGDITIAGNVGGTLGFGTLSTVKARTAGGSVVFGGDIVAKTVNVRGAAFSVNDVTTTSTQTYSGLATFGGAITSGKDLRVTTQGDIVNTAPWTVVGKANLKTRIDADITITGAGNNFGTLQLAGENATIVEASNTNFVSVKLTGDLNVTSTGDITQTGRLTAQQLDATSGGTIAFTGGAQRLNFLGNISAQTGITILSGGQNLIISGDLTNVNGDVIVSANYRGTNHNVQNLSGPNAIQISGAGRFLIYSYSSTLTSLGGLAVDFTETGKRYPDAPLLANTGDGVIYVVV